MKILFIQLPLVDHSNSYINGNINYASSVITAFIKKNFSNIQCEYLPSVLSNFCSDRMIINYIKNVSPDIINFTCYLWNIERNLLIARTIKKILPHSLIVFGGSEINDGSIAFQNNNSYVDYFVKGEGEWFYNKLLNRDKFEISSINDNNYIVQPFDELLDSHEIVEPLSNNYLDIMPDRSVFVELVRGCPYRCSYCLYSNGIPKVREIDPSCLLDIIESGKEIDEVYILAPTFDMFKDFEKILKVLKEKNPGINLHTEVRAERFDDNMAKMMYEAGFRSLEVGLQSLNPRALLEINRKSDPDKEISGITALKTAGINLKIGIIPGLPDDDPGSFINTIDKLVENELSESIELYQLMVLPGSKIRDKAISENVVFQNKPPYFFIEGWNFTQDDMINITNYFENVTGYTQSIYSLPNFIWKDDALFTRSIRLNCHDTEKIIIEDFFRLIDTFVMDIHLECTSVVEFYGLFRDIVEYNKEGRLINFIIYSNEQLNEMLLSEVIEEFDSDNFFKRLNYYNTLKDQFQYRFYQVFDDLEMCNLSVDAYSLINSIYKINSDDTDSNLRKLSDFANVIVTSDSYEKIKDYLFKLDDFERIAFESETDMNNFYVTLGIDFISYPVDFGIKYLK